MRPLPTVLAWFVCLCVYPLDITVSPIHKRMNGVGVCMPAVGNATRVRRVVDRTINSYSLPLSAMNLQWVPTPYGSELGGATPRRKTSKAWSFMGQLVRAVTPEREGADSAETKVFHSLMSDLLYCRLCFEEQLAAEPYGSLAKVVVSVSIIFVYLARLAARPAISSAAVSYFLTTSARPVTSTSTGPACQIFMVDRTMGPV